jgi:integrase
MASYTSAKIGAAADEYLRYMAATKSKSKSTLYKEELSLNGWRDFLEDTLLRKITLDDIREYAAFRSEEGVSNRTINLDVGHLKNLLVWFRDANRLPSPLATANWKNLDHTTPTRRLIPTNTVELIEKEAARVDADGLSIYQTGQFLSDFVKLLAYSGARKRAALDSKWSDVDWENKQIRFTGKYKKTVHVDFNPDLEAHLRAMFTRRNKESEYLFPGQTFDTVISPYTVFNDIRAAIGQTDLHLHDFRHFFISRAVMSGIDSMTIARWVGHADGGVLIGKVYGHLSNPHLKMSAAKLSFAEASA